MKRVGPIAALFVASVVAAAPGESVVDRATSQLAATFTKLDARGPAPPSSWAFAATPPLPDFSSSTTPRPYAVYGYATRFDPGLADAIRVSAAWGAAHVQPAAGAVVFQSISQKIVELGVQGSKPVAASQIPTSAEISTAYRWVSTGVATAPPPEVRRVYCDWAQGNGLIAGSLPSGARAFIASLGCRR